MKILIIDDEAGLRRVYARILTRAGFEVVSAEDGPQGLALLKEEEAFFDVVLCDMRMPGLNGIDVHAQAPEGSFGRWVFNTGWCLDQDRAYATKHGLQILGKPVEQAVLLAVISAQ